MYDIFSVTSRCKINISFINMEISGKIIVAMSRVADSLHVLVIIGLCRAT